MSAALEHIVLPPSATGDSSVRDTLAQIAAAGDRLTLTLSDGTDVVVPAELVEILHDAAATMLTGRAVTVTPHNTSLTTQQAAEMLGISRPTLVRLLEAGDIAYTQPGRHRRVALEDLMHYQVQMKRSRRSALETMAEEAAEDDLYAAGPGLIKTR